MATKLTFINDKSETEPLLTEWTTGNIVTSNRLNKIQTAITKIDAALLGTERNSTTGMTTLENMLQVTSNQVTIGNAAVITNSTTSPNSVATFNVNAALTVGGSSSETNRNLVVNGAISANSYSGTGNTIILSKGANINGSLTVGNNGNLSVAGKATIEGTFIEKNKITLAESQATTDVGNNELVSKALLDATINDAIGQLDVEQISCTGLTTLGTIKEVDGKINVTTRTIPYATDENGGYMSTAHVTALNASAQQVSYSPVYMDAEGNVVTAISTSTSTRTSADSHTAYLGPVVTSLTNVASKAEVNVLSKDINGDYTDADPANHVIGLKDIVWGREASGSLGAITGLVENVNKLSSLSNLPTDEGRYVLEVRMDSNNNPVINWVPLENDGGEST